MAEDNKKAPELDPGRDLPEPSTDPEATADTNVKEDDAEGDTDLRGSGAADSDRVSGPVGPPHWNALMDIFRVLPCQVNPINTDDWYTVVDVKEENGETILVTSKGDELRGRDIGDPVLVRTNDPSAKKLK